MHEWRSESRVLALAVLCVALSVPPALGGPNDGTVLGVTRVIDHGPDSLRWNLVIAAEGFTGAQQGLFNTRAQELTDYLLARAPFNTYKEAINVLRLNVASNESGADDPAECGGTGHFANTYFDASFCNGGIQRLLVVNDSLSLAVLNTWTPEWDQAIVIVNSTEYGGAGGSIAVTSLTAGWTAVMIHELGHGFGMADEYDYWSGCGYDTEYDHHPSYEPSEPNVTINTNRATVKWRDLIEPATPVPTTTNADCSVCDPQPDPYPPETVGLFEGAQYYHCDAYRPQYYCRMRALSSGFCRVCEREIGWALTPYLPAQARLSLESINPASGVTLTVSPPDTSNEGNGSTPFVRIYNRLSTVTVGAPATAAGNGFAEWQLDGSYYRDGTTVTLGMDVSHTIAAKYLSCTQSTEQPAVNPPSPVCVSQTYCLAWNRLAGASSYEIRENGGSWVGTGADTSRCYSKTAGGSYSYEVRVVSPCGQSIASPPRTITVENSAPQVPSQPWIDPPSPVCVNTDYVVHWDSSPGVQRYEIRENGGAWQNLGRVTSYYDLKPAAGTYTYEIRALNVCGPSAPGPSVSMTMTTQGATPAVPGQPSVMPSSPVCVNRQYTIHWNPVPGAAYYEVRENAGEWHSCGATTMWGAIKYAPGVNSYQVRAANGCGQSAPSASVNVTIGKCFDLIVYSGYPIDGVPIVVSPIDQDGMGDAPTPFVRTYGRGSSVTLQAPSTFNGTPFERWLRDGVNYSGSPTIAFNVDTARTLTVFYGTCDCPAQGDIDGDASIDVSDVLKVIQVAFVNGTDIQDPDCLTTRGDVNNSGTVDVQDVLYIIKTAFTNGPNPVNPCGP